MQDYPEKPKNKRKNSATNPYMLVTGGIIIGLMVAAVVAVFFFGVSTAPEPEFVASPIPTEAPIVAQGVQPTPIANRIQAASMSNDGSMLAYVSVENGTSHIYLNELRVERNLTGNQYDLYQSAGTYNDVVFSPDGSKLIATIDNGSALLFDVNTRTLIEEYAQIGGAAFTNDSNTLVLVGRNNGIRVLDVSTNQPTLIDSRDTSEQDYLVGAVAISNNQTVAVALNERIEIYQLSDLSIAPQIITPNNGFVQDLAFHPAQDNTLAVALAGTNALNGVIQIYDLNNTSRSQYDFGTRVFAVAFSPDGDWLAVAGGESGFAESRLIAFRWDTEDVIPPNAETFYQPLSFEGHEHTIFDVTFTREGYLLSASWDGSVRLWELMSPQDAISVYYP